MRRSQAQAHIPKKKKKSEYLPMMRIEPECPGQPDLEKVFNVPRILNLPFQLFL